MPLSPTEMYPAQAPQITVRTLTLRTGIQMRIAEHGPLHGPTVVMLHGWGALLYMYRHALDRLPAAGFRTVAVDLRGYGLSDKPTADDSYSLMAYQADIDALLDELGADRVALVGHSMGGGLALRYALTRPQRVSKLALINPSGLSAVPYLRLLQSVPAPLLAAIGSTLVPRWAIGWILRHIAYTDASLVTERDIDEYWAPTQRLGYVHAARADTFPNAVLEALASGRAVVGTAVGGSHARDTWRARPLTSHLERRGCKTAQQSCGTCSWCTLPTRGTPRSRVCDVG